MQLDAGKWCLRFGLHSPPQLIASKHKAVQWTSPLGLPIVQPYMDQKKFSVKTPLQVILR